MSVPRKGNLSIRLENNLEPERRTICVPVLDTPSAHANLLSVASLVDAVRGAVVFDQAGARIYASTDNPGDGLSQIASSQRVGNMYPMNIEVGRSNTSLASPTPLRHTDMSSDHIYRQTHEQSAAPSRDNSHTHAPRAPTRSAPSGSGPPRARVSEDAFRGVRSNNRMPDHAKLALFSDPIAEPHAPPEPHNPRNAPPEPHNPHDQPSLSDQALITLGRAEREVMRVHRAFQHPHLQRMQRLARQGLLDAPLSALARRHLLTMSSLDCADCVVAKMAKNPVPKKSTVKVAGINDREGGQLDADTAGPFRESWFSKKRYFTVVVHHRTRRTWLLFLKDRSEFLVEMQKLYDQMRATLKDELIFFMTDNAGEFTSEALSDWFRSEKVTQKFSCPNSSAQNGIAERMIRTLRESAHAALAAAGLPQEFWAEAVRHAAYVRNHTWAGTLAMTPDQLLKGYEYDPRFSKFHPFGCRALSLIPQTLRTKFEAKVRECIYLGVSEHHHDGYRLLSLETGRILISRDVSIFPDFFPFRAAAELRAHAPAHPPTNLSKPKILREALAATGATPVSLPYNHEREHKRAPLDLPFAQPNTPDPILHRTESTAFAPLQHHLPIDLGQFYPDEEELDQVQEEEIPEPQNPIPTPPRRPRRERHAPPRWNPADDDAQRFWDKSKAMFQEEEHRSPDIADFTHTPRGDTEVHRAYAAVMDEPSSYRAACASEDWPTWERAIREELDNMSNNDTWVPIKRSSLPAGARAIRSKWTFKIKRRNGVAVRHKARLVVRGDMQKEGVDYFETFSPTTRWPSVRAFLALANQNNLPMRHLDVTAAFLIPSLPPSERVFIEVPEGVEGVPADQVLELKKSMYGLKQAGRARNKEIDSTLRSLGFAATSADPCWYVKRVAGRIVAQVLLYVDDMLCAGADSELDSLARQLSERYSITDDGEPSWFLGVSVARDTKAGTLLLSQEAYTARVLTLFNMLDCNPASTPADTELLSSSTQPTTDEERNFMKRVPYREAVGALMYLAIATRPDIAFAVNQTAKFCADPGRRHWGAVKRIMAYLSGTRTQGIDFRRTSNQSFELRGYSDADDAGDKDTRRSVSAYAFYWGDALISWNSCQQKIATLSSCESELVALTKASCEALHLSGLVHEVTGSLAAVNIFEDNNAARSVSSDSKFSKSLKHVARRHFMVQQHVAAGRVRVLRCPTTHMLADILTKPLSPVIFNRVRDYLLQGTPPPCAQAA